MRPELQKALSETVTFPKLYGVQKTAHYRTAVNLTPFGLPVMFHQDCQHGGRKIAGKNGKLLALPSGSHKVEILQTGEKSIGEIGSILGRMFDTDPDRLPIMRADLTADIKGVTVPWFRDHTYLPFKRLRRQIGYIPAAPWMAVQNAVAQTIYMGKAPNQHRIYDKVAEQRYRYQRDARCAWNKLKREFSASMQAEVREPFSLCEDAEDYLEASQFADELLDAHKLPELNIELSKSIPDFPTFEARFGHSETAIITRVERQTSGRDLDRLGLDNFASLVTLPQLHPFEKLQFFKGDFFDPEPYVKGQKRLFKPNDYLAGLTLRKIAADQGIEALRLFMRQHYGDGNYRRYWKKFLPFYGTVGHEKGVSAIRLQREYERSCEEQLAA